MSEWISVKDRLPMEPSHSVVYENLGVLATDGFVVHECSFLAGHGAGKPWVGWSQYNNIEGSAITHWQPLPPPPAEGE